MADTWSSETFTKFGIASVFFLLFVFVFVIGPPPDDGELAMTARHGHVGASGGMVL